MDEDEYFETEPVGQGSVALTGVAGMPPTSERRTPIRKMMSKGYSEIQKRTITPLKARLKERAKIRKKLKLMEKRAYQQALTEGKQAELQQRIALARQKGIAKATWEAKPLREKLRPLGERLRELPSKFGDMPSKMESQFGSVSQPRQLGTIKPPSPEFALKPIDLGFGFKQKQSKKVKSNNPLDWI